MNNRLCVGLFLAAGALALTPGPALAQEKQKGKNSDEDCLACHSDESIEAETKRGRSLRLVVKPGALRGSVHEELSCTECHVGAKTWEEAPHNEGKKLSLECAGCHEKASEQYEMASVHGSAYRKKRPRAPWCHDCHGGHSIVPLTSGRSALSPIRQPRTCGRCHTSPMGEGIAKRKLVQRYRSSVHWLRLKQGKPAASCTDCHGKHSILPSSDARSMVSHEGLVKTCAHCHKEASRTYSKGSHGRTLLLGNLDVPTCTTCHGDHDMMSLRSRGAGQRNFAGTQVCIWCHGNARMMARYALDTSPVESYMKDFHGLTQRGTKGASATCSDCHDPHHSLPESHPESRMNLSNRGATCGKCHGKTSGTFIMSFTHKAVAVDHGGSIKRTVVTIYIVLIVTLIGAMVLHNLIIWLHALRRKVTHQKRFAKIVRLNRFERGWHVTLLLSFCTLVFTGFALKFPDSVWFQWLYALGLTESARSLVHRVSAVVMIGSLVLFFGYQIVSRAGRKWWSQMLPRWSDLRDVGATLRYHVGKRAIRPRYGIFSYVEKIEYWALLWGALIMLATGLVLWFPKSLPERWPSWVIDVARLIHFYEAILASLAIVVWHFFHTIFRPGEYPMDTSWLTGTLTDREAGHRFTEEALRAQLRDGDQRRLRAEDADGKDDQD